MLCNNCLFCSARRFIPASTVHGRLCALVCPHQPCAAKRTAESRCSRQTCRRWWCQPAAKCVRLSSWTLKRWTGTDPAHCRGPGQAGGWRSREAHINANSKGQQSLTQRHSTQLPGAPEAGKPGTTCCPHSAALNALQTSCACQLAKQNTRSPGRSRPRGRRRGSWPGRTQPGMCPARKGSEGEGDNVLWQLEPQQDAQRAKQTTHFWKPRAPCSGSTAVLAGPWPPACGRSPRLPLHTAPLAFHTIWVQARAPSGGCPAPALYWLLPPVHRGMAAAHVFHPVPAAWFSPYPEPEGCKGWYAWLDVTQLAKHGCKQNAWQDRQHACTAEPLHWLGLGRWFACHLLVTCTHEQVPAAL